MLFDEPTYKPTLTLKACTLSIKQSVESIEAIQEEIKAEDLTALIEKTEKEDIPLKPAEHRYEICGRVAKMREEIRKSRA